MLATVLLLAFVAQTFSAPFIRLDYYFNQADYARNCINKSRPEMNCNGKCQVMKKILAEEKNEQDAQQRKMNSKVEVLSSKCFFINSIPTPPSIIASVNPSDFNINTVIDRASSIFHPPCM